MYFRGGNLIVGGTGNKFNSNESTSGAGDASGSGSANGAGGIGFSDVYNEYFDVQISNAEMIGNKGVDGGALNFNYVNASLKDVTLKDNTAKYTGGALYHGRGKVTMDGVNVSGNHANKAGAMYLECASEFLKGSIGGNSTDAEDGGTLYLLMPIDSREKIYLDPVQMKITDTIYMDTATSKLSLLNPIPDTEEISFSVNKEKFVTGSVIAVPAGNVALNGQNYSYTDASQAAKNFKPVSIPEKMRVGAFKKNVVLLNPGVYISDEGQDIQDGSDPENAVATFAKAKELLEQNIIQAKASGVDYDPYIYVCGSIKVNGTENWSLKQDLGQNELSREIITEQKQVKLFRFASYYGHMVEVTAGTTLNLTDIILDGNKLGVDGPNNNIKAIIGVNGTLSVGDGADVTSNYGDNITATGEKAAVTVTGTTPGGRVSYPHTNAIDANGGATVIMEGTGHVDSTGEDSNYDETILLKSGVQIQGEGTTLLMKDNSYIYDIENGVHVGGGQADITGQSRIELCEEGVRSAGGITKIYGEATIKNCQYGIRGVGEGDTWLYGSASVTREDKTGSNGYWGSGNSKLHMYENAEINNVYRGIYLENGSPKAIIDGESVIQNAEEEGIGTLIWQDSDQIEVTLGGNAKILSCTNGVNGRTKYSSVTGTTNVTIQDNAVIDGVKGEAAGGKYGIHDAGAAMTFLLKDHAAVQNFATGGVYVKTSMKESSAGSLTLDGNASVKTNKGNGITIVRGGDESEAPLSKAEYIVRLKGDSSVIENAGRGMEAQRYSEIHLEENSSVQGNSTSTPELEGAGIHTRGKLYLAGGAVVSDEIYMGYVGSPIVLTSPVQEGITFKLGCERGFMGLPVVVPEDETAFKASDYITAFEETGLPLDCVLQVKSPNINVSAGKDVYIAGDGSKEGIAPGDDENNGLSTDTPVRTFARAVQILKESVGGGNIYICNYPVEVKKGDENWSIGENGMVSNGDTEWKPTIIREKNFKDDMITISVDKANQVQSMTIKNIDIDGNAKNTGLVQGTVLKIGGIKSFQLTLDNVGFLNNESEYIGSTRGAGAMVLESNSEGTYVVKNCRFEKNKSMQGSPLVQFIQGVSGSITSDWQGCSFSDNYSESSEINVYGALRMVGTMTMKDSSFVRNKVHWNNQKSDPDILGNSLYFNGTKLNMENCTVENNETTGISASYGNGYGSVAIGNGTVQITGGSISNNKINTLYKSRGAGLYVTGGQVVLEDTKIEGNSVANSSSEDGDIGGGFCIYSGTATLRGVTIKGNSCERGGGGIGVLGGTLNIENSIISNNESKGRGTSQGYGGGLYCIRFTNANTNIKISNTTIDNNKARSGGGIYYQAQNGSLRFLSGNIQNNSALINGGGIYYGTGDLTLGTLSLEGGKVNNNYIEGKKDKVDGENSGIYVNAINFNIKGGGCNISDYIYLYDVKYPVTLSGSIYQKGRLYKISLNTASSTNMFKEGSVVVKPDNVVVTNATQYHKYFEASAKGLVLEKGSPNLILKQCVFIDSSKSDTNSGKTPAEAVATFKRAKEICKNKDAIIYISGEVKIKGTEEWELDPSCYVARYRGFSITGIKFDSYNGDMITVEAGGNLSTKNISIYGRRDIDEEINTGSIIKVADGGSYNMQEGTVLSRNKTADMGGAVKIENGTVSISGGSILETVSAVGSAIYQNGLLNLSGTSEIQGDVYLEGIENKDSSSRYIGASADYNPVNGTVLQVGMRNPFATRHVIRYPDGYETAQKDIDKYKLDANVLAVYRFNTRTSAKEVLELQQKGVVYVDGTRGYGNDGNDGRTPKTSVATIEQAYRLLAGNKEGGLIIVVGTVPVTSGITLTNVKVGDGWTATCKSGGETIDVGIPVSIRRYAQPTAYEELDEYDKFEVTSCTDALFEVKDGGDFKLEGFTVDGHSKEILGDKQFAAQPVEVQAPLFMVGNSGTLTALDSTFENNNNVAPEGQGGAVSIKEGTADLENTNLRNVKARTGSAVYQDGKLVLSRQPVIDGEVYLEGDGSVGHSDQSRYIDIKLIGFRPVGDKMDIRFKDVYNGRPIALYPTGFASSVTGSDIEIYQTEQYIRDQYAINKRVAQAEMLELQLKPAIYIDGVDGNDSNNGETADHSVKTLEKAYKRLKEIGGGALYVVNTVKVSKDMKLSEKTYDTAEISVEIEGTPTEVRRYVQPDAWETLPQGGFTHLTNKNVLFLVTETGSLDIENLVIDGHKNKRTEGDLLPQIVVSTETKASAPLIQVADKGKLYLNDGAVLQNNDNEHVKPEDPGMDGGAIANYGEIYFNNGLLAENKSAKGSGIYQHGLLALEAGIRGIGTHEIYLAAENTGTDESPVWTDYVITVADKIPNDVLLHVNMDHAMRSRNVAVFDNSTAFDEKVENEIVRFDIGDSKPVNLPLIQSLVSSEQDTLELHDYTNVDVRINWDDHNNLDNTRPTGDVKVYVKNNSVVTGTVTTNALGSWQGTLINVNKYVEPKYEDLLLYDVAGEELEGYTQTEDQATHTVTYHYTPKRTVTYDANGANGGEVPADPSSPYVYDTSVTVLGNSVTNPLTRTGYIFAGWNTKSDGTGTAYQADGTFVIQNNTTLYAMWLKADKESVEEVADNKLRPEEKLTYKIQITAPQNGALTVTDDIPAGTSYIENSAKADVTTGVTITHADNKLTWEFSNVTAQAVLNLEFKIQINAGTAPNAEVKNKAEVTVVGKTYPTNETTDIVAETAKVVYDGNGSDKGLVPVDANYYTSGETATVLGNNGNGQPKDELQKDNARFAGWNTKSDGSGTHYNQGQSIAMDGKTDVKLYAMWVGAEKTAAVEKPDDILRPGHSITYTIRVSVPEDAAQAVVTDTIPTGTSYVEGSATDTAAEEAVYDPATRQLTWTLHNMKAGAERTLSFKVRVNGGVASGTEIQNTASVEVGGNSYTTNTQTNEVGTTYTVTYEANGGTGDVPVDPNYYAVNEKAVVQNNGDGTSESGLTREGWEFVGWNTKADGKGTHYDGGQKITMTGDVVLHAVWLKVEKSAAVERPGEELRPGQTINYTIKVLIPENTGTVTVTDKIPEGTTYIEGTATNTPENQVTYNQNTKKLTWILTNVQAGVERNLSFSVKVNANAAGGTEIENQASVIVGDHTYLTNVQINGVGTTYTVRYKPNGGVGKVPEDTNYYVRSEKAVVKGNIGDGNTGTELKREDLQFAGWNTEADGSGTHYNTSNEITMTDNVVLYAVWVKAEKTAVVEKPGEILRPGQKLIYNITVSVPEGAAQVVVTDIIPAGTTYVTGSATSTGAIRASYDEAGRKLTWTISNLGAGIEKVLSFTVTVNENVTGGTLIENQASLEVGGNTYTTNKQVNEVGTTYTVNYEANGGTGETPTDSSHYAVNEKATVKGNTGDGTEGSGLSKAGMKFAGWNTSADGSGTHYDGGNKITMTGNVTLYAVWLKAEKSAETGNPDGNVRPGQTIDYTITVSVPEDMEKVLVTDLIPVGTTYVAGSATDTDSEKVVYDAIGKKLTWTLENMQAGVEKTLRFTVRVNGGISGGTQIENTALVTAGENSYTTNIQTNTVGTTYTVKYEANGGVGKVPTDSSYYTKDETATVLGNIGDGNDETKLVKEDLKFAGWNTAADGSGTHYDGGNEITMTGNVVLYAVWLKADKTAAIEKPGEILRPGQKITYSITVAVPENAAQVVVTDIIPSGTTYVKGSATNTAAITASYDEAGRKLTWTLSNLGAGTEKVLSFAVKVNENVTGGTQIENQASVEVGGNSYTTNKQINEVGTTYKVSYEPNGGTGETPTDSSHYAVNEKATVKGNIGDGTEGSELSKAGMEFAGWNTSADGSGTHYDGGNKITMTGNVILYAVWLKAEKSSVTENPGEILRPGQTISYTIQVSVPEDAAEVTVTDQIPNGTIYVDGTATGAIYDAAARKLTWTLSDVKAGEEQTLSFTVRVNAGLTAGTEIENTASVKVGENTYTTNTQTNTVGTTYTVKYEANGGVGKVPTDSTFYVKNEKAEVLGNIGDGNDETKLVKEDLKFAGWNTAADGSGTHYDGGNELTMTGNVVLYAVWLKAEKTAAVERPDEILRPGQKITYSITVAVPENAAQVVVTDIIPSGTTYVKGSATNTAAIKASYDEAGRKLTWTLSNLGAGTEKVLSFAVKVNENVTGGTQIENQASVEVGGNSYTTNKQINEVGTTYKVSYEPNGGTGETPTDNTHYAVNEKATVKGNTGDGTEGSELSKAGMEFAGWNTSADGSGTHYDGGSKITMTGNVTLYAVWMKAEKSAETGNPDGNVRPGQTIDYTITVSVPENTEKVLVTDLIPAGTTYVADSATDTDSEKVVYDATNKKLTWTLANMQAGVEKTLSFTVRLNAGAVAGTQIVNTASVKVGDNTYTTNTQTNTVGTTYTVKYEANGGVGKVPTDSNYYSKDETATVLGNIGDGNDETKLVKGDLKFAGWNTAADGSGTHYDGGNEITMTGNVVLYAVWVKAEKTAAIENPDEILKPGQKITYSITVAVPENAAQVVVTDIIPSGTTYVKGSATNTAAITASYDEAGRKLTWTLSNLGAGTEKVLSFAVKVNDDVTGGTQIENQASVEVGGNTYTTNKQINEVGTTYKVNYEANGGTGETPTDNTHYAVNEKATVKGNTGDGTEGSELSKAGMEFAGWNTSADGSGTHYDGGGKITMTSNVTLYAVWLKAEKSAVTENPGESLRPGQTIHYTIKVTVPEDTDKVTVTDTIPSGTTYVEGTATDTATEKASYDEENQKLTWTLTNMKAGVEKTLTFTVKVNAGVTGGTSIENQAAVKVGENTYTTNTQINGVGTTYTVSYDANGGVGKVPTDSNFYVKNEKAEVKGNTGDGTEGSELGKDDLQFGGWNTSADGSGTHYDSGSEITMTGNVVLYAVWLKAEKTAAVEKPGEILRPGQTIRYTITVEVPEDAKELTVTDKIPEGTTYVEGTATDNATEKAIYDKTTQTLTWTLKNVKAQAEKALSFTVRVKEGVTGGTQIKNEASVKVGENTYTTNTQVNEVGTTYTVSYDSNGGTGKTPEDPNHYAKDEKAKVQKNGDGTPESGLSKEGWEFTGWNTKADGSGTHYDGDDQITMTENITLYAMWAKAVKTSAEENPTDALKVGEKLTYTIQYEAPAKSGKITVKDQIPEGTEYVTGSANEGGIYSKETRTITWSFDGSEESVTKLLTFKVSVKAGYKDGGVIENKAQITVGKNSFETNLVENTVEKSYEITYEGNGNETGAPPKDENYYLDGDSTVVSGNTGESADPGKGPMTVTDGEFAGWNTKPDGSGKTWMPGENCEMHSDTVLYAMWIKMKKTSEKEKPDEILKPQDTLQYKIKVTIPVKSERVTITDTLPEGVTYEGTSSPKAEFKDGTLTWTLNQVEANAQYELSFTVKVNQDAEAGEKIQNQAGITMDDQTFVTNTTTDEVGETYQITYDGNHADTGIIPVDGQFYASEKDVTVRGNDGNGNPENSLAKKNSIFQGWNTRADGSGTHYDQEAVFKITGDTTLYAMWATAEKTSVRKEESQSLKPGDELRYDITVTMPEDTQTVIVKDQIPENTTYVKDSATMEGRYSEGVIQWTLAGLKAGETTTLSFAVTVNANLSEGTRLENQAQVETGKNSFTTNKVTDQVGRYFKVTYDANGGKGMVPADQTNYEDKASVSVLGNIGTGKPETSLTREGFVFTGWNTSKDGQGTSYQAGNTFEISQNTTLYAMWFGVQKTSAVENTAAGLKPGDKISYTIKLTVPSDTTELTVRDVIPAGTEYVEGTANENGIYTKETQSIVWKLKNLKAGEVRTISFIVKTKSSLAEGDKVENTADVIIGKNTYQTTTATDTVGRMVHIQYYGNGNTAGDPPVDEKNYVPGEAAVIRGNTGGEKGAMSKGDSIFTGWNTKQDGTGTSYTAKETVKLPEDLNLYAMWMTASKQSSEQKADGILRPGEEIRYKITAVIPDNQKKVTITDQIPQGTEFVKGSAGEGAYAGGKLTWTFRNVNAGTKLEAEFTVRVKDSMSAGDKIKNQARIVIGENSYKTETVTDKVGKTYQITYDGNGAGSGQVPVDNHHYANGENGTLKSNDGNGNISQQLQKSGMQFNGWNTKPDGTGTAYQSGASLKMTGNITLYAVWKAVTVPNTNNGTGNNVPTATTPVNTVANPAKTGDNTPDMSWYLLALLLSAGVMANAFAKGKKKKQKN